MIYSLGILVLTLFMEIHLGHSSGIAEQYSKVKDKIKFKLPGTSGTTYSDGFKLPAQIPRGIQGDSVVRIGELIGDFTPGKSSRPSKPPSKLYLKDLFGLSTILPSGQVAGKIKIGKLPGASINDKMRIPGTLPMTGGVADLLRPGNFGGLLPGGIWPGAVSDERPEAIRPRIIKRRKEFKLPKIPLQLPGSGKDDKTSESSSAGLKGALNLPVVRLHFKKKGGKSGKKTTGRVFNDIQGERIYQVFFNPKSFPTKLEEIQWRN